MWNPRFRSVGCDVLSPNMSHMRDALPHVSFIGFTGIPIELQDANARTVFSVSSAPPKPPEAQERNGQTPRPPVISIPLSRPQADAFPRVSVQQLLLRRPPRTRRGGVLDPDDTVNPLVPRWFESPAPPSARTQVIVKLLRREDESPAPTLEPQPVALPKG